MKKKNVMESIKSHKNELLCVGWVTLWTVGIVLLTKNHCEEQAIRNMLQGKFVDIGN